MSIGPTLDLGVGRELHVRRAEPEQGAWRVSGERVDEESVVELTTHSVAPVSRPATVRIALCMRCLRVPNKLWW